MAQVRSLAAAQDAIIAMVIIIVIASAELTIFRAVEIMSLDNAADGQGCSCACPKCASVANVDGTKT